MYSNDDSFWGIIFLLVFPVSLMGMLVFIDRQGYKKGVNETLILCMENAKDCKIKYDYLKLEQQK
jgi:mannose/fructose/N-acetylgalactosamine-specific phosphotransferase system component IID